MEFEKIHVGRDYYWAWRDIDFLPYGWLDERELETLPLPIYAQDLHPDCPVGVPCGGEETKTNEIRLPATFGQLNLDPDLRTDLRRVERKNAGVQVVEGEKGALEKASPWFLQFWGEKPDDFRRRMELWKGASTLSAYEGEELLGVHIAFHSGNSVYYLGCWWDRNHKNRSIPTFLLSRDIERAISLSKSGYDLGIGSEPYKKQWGVTERQVKYYARMPARLAEKLGISEFDQMPRLRI